MLAYITSNDKNILIFIGFFFILNAGLILTCYFWCKNNVGIYVAVSLVCYLSHVPFYRTTKTFQELMVSEIITIVAGFLLGIIFWSIFWYESGGGLTWSILFILILAYLLI